ncbi:hypothetical protein HFP89_01370 [Wenzhouxiangella sp. XN79A]|uniref:hypothetical protein n=1 Tax=Wenzhouxiangella sp. XN79A TaxID=2724193 RepID=UPI00144AC24D|nr:hypothetical protein [Wenzhouxiangella sp. XN79A]NKI33813.1 hypothetical protein [Wenzhouxiangella sp. XN79A]
MLAALLAVLLLRALVPAGFMPGSDGWVQLCSLDGARWVLDADGASSSQDRCFWDQALTSAVLPDLARLSIDASFPGASPVGRPSAPAATCPASGPPARASPSCA